MDGQLSLPGGRVAMVAEGLERGWLVPEEQDDLAPPDRLDDEGQLISDMDDLTNTLAARKYLGLEEDA